MVDPKWFAGRLRELRAAAGLERKELAERAGFRSEGGVRDLEQGLTLPRWDTVVALCQALGVLPTEFMVEPAGAPEPKRGRPRKAAPGASPTERPPKSQHGRAGRL